MNMLCVETSATAASVALLCGERVAGQFFIHTRLTHSQTLVPMLDALMRTCECSWEEVEALSVAVGPGSFTGIRIGVATVKGLAFSRGVPCIGVSTLEAMAHPLRHMEGKVLCCVMDARCSQVYNAMFCVKNGTLVRLCNDRALSVEELSVELSGEDREVVLVGDGAELCFSAMKGSVPTIALAPPHLRFQSAVGVGFAAVEAAKVGGTIMAADLAPVYLRLPQAERELKKKQAEKEKLR